MRPIPVTVDARDRDGPELAATFISGPIEAQARKIAAKEI
jgi:hypothetical protein